MKTKSVTPKNSMNINSLLQWIKKIDPLTALIIFFICGRYYFLFGYTGHLKPVAPMPLIFIKDTLLIAICLYYFKTKTNNGDNKNRVVFLFWFFSLTAIIAIHFYSKSFSDWGQHYVRNVFLVFLSAPSLYKSELEDSSNRFIKIIFWAGFLNLIVALLQPFFFQQALLGGTRPLGLVGDPTSLTLIICIFIFSFLLLKIPNWAIFLLTFLSGYIINISGSLSGSLSGIIAIIFVGYFYCKKYSNFNLRKVIIICLALLSSLFIPTGNNLDTLLTKAKVYVYYNGYLDSKKLAEHRGVHEDESHLYDSMKNGRAKSVETLVSTIETQKIEQAQTTTLPFTSELKFLFGDFKNPVYGRYDSTPTVLIMNWGALTLCLFYFTLAYTLFQTIKDIYKFSNRPISGQKILALFCFVSFSIAGFLNSIWYRSPINFILLYSVVILLTQTKNKTNTES